MLPKSADLVTFTDELLMKNFAVFCNGRREAKAESPHEKIKVREAIIIKE